MMSHSGKRKFVPGVLAVGFSTLTLAAVVFAPPPKKTAAAPGTIVSDGVKLLREHPTEVVNGAKTVWSWLTSPSTEAIATASTANATPMSKLFVWEMDDPDSMLTLHLSGDANFQGWIENQKGVKGSAVGFHRGDYGAIQYASMDPSRPGLTTYYVKPYLSATAGGPVSYIGIAVGVACGCADGSVKMNGKLTAVPVYISTVPVLPSDIRKRISRPEKQIEAVWPSDLQDDADKAAKKTRH